jgi:hypothetical protein
MGLFTGTRSARATGGTVTTAGPYTVHSFTTTGANTFTAATTGFIDILLIGGGGGGGTGYGAGGGGAGATLYKKMISVTAGTPYPINVGTGGAGDAGGGSIAGTGGVTTFTYAGITTTAYGGGGGYGAGSYPNSNAGGSAPNASGGGAASRNTAPTNPIGGIGANIYGVGYPGGGGSQGGGGGAGGAGGFGTPGPGVPVAYFTGNPSHIASIGGQSGGDSPYNPPPTSSLYAPFNFGHGGGGMTYPSVGSPGAAFIRYI